MNHSLLYIVLLVIFFFLTVITLLAIYVIYLKKIDKVDAAYFELKKHGFLPCDFFSLQESIGFLGFGGRVFILSRILKNKKFRLHGKVYFEPRLAALVINRNDFRWIYYYNILNFLLIFIFIVFLCMAIMVKFPHLLLGI